MKHLLSEEKGPGRDRKEQDEKHSRGIRWERKMMPIGERIEDTKR